MIPAKFTSHQVIFCSAHGCAEHIIGEPEESPWGTAEERTISLLRMAELRGWRKWWHRKTMRQLIYCPGHARPGMPRLVPDRLRERFRMP